MNLLKCLQFKLIDIILMNERFSKFVLLTLILKNVIYPIMIVLNLRRFGFSSKIVTVILLLTFWPLTVIVTDRMAVVPESQLGFDHKLKFIMNLMNGS